MKLSRIALGMAIAALPLAGAQANQSLNSAGTSATLGGVSNPGSIHSSSHNPASSNIMVREGERFRFGYLSNIGGYLELGEVDDIDDEVEGLIDDIEALDALEEAGNDYNNLSEDDRELVDALARHNQNKPADEQCSPSSLDGTNADMLANCYQGVADNLNDGLLEDLEKGGQLRFGGSVSVPLMPFLFKGGRDWTFGVNVAAHAQFRGQMIASPFGVATTFRTVQNSTSGSGVFASGASASSDGFQSLSADLNISSDKIGKTFVVLDSLIDEYDQADDKDAFLQQYESYDANATEDENYLNAVIEVLKKDAGYTDEELESLTTLAQDETFRQQMQDGSAKLEVDADFTTDTAMEAKAAGVTHLALNYAHNLTSALNLDPTHGTLEGGVRLNYYQARMHRGFLSLRGAAEDDYYTASGDDAADRSGDFFVDDYTQESALGLDVGLLWHARNYQVGATMYNVNEPEFQYPNLADMFADPIFDDQGNVKDRDRTAAENLAAAGRLVLDESVTLTRHTVLEAAYFNDNRTWSLHGYYTLGTATNFVGDEFQDVGISAGYFTQSWLIPGVRAGYNKNLTGTELTTVSAGGTFFGIFNLDMAMSLDTSTVDGTEFPRYFAINLGFEEKF
ncbi:plasmid transfer operon, TraF, protein [Marinospirillum celere]|uniref:Plasmid transfer operon, TraF, protein n=1 Tax=Marinospirillum celere TaxID=1122252 RepID=A0A1I1E8M4_9GAMM|nr:conjugal transfer protein TraF [Marinospirillum celere]SFB83485.1 plasmid transfer operon, TraF, protein [Marinospirillum celere]